jgi:ubiquinone/menaquinone biosynthesis C-methylase UbiE
MTDFYNKNNQIYYESVKNYPPDHRAVKWGSTKSQFLRFKVLCEISPEIFNSDILDVGCGLGHLVDYLIAKQFTGGYKGIDIVDEMIVRAKKRHPLYLFQTNDIDSIPVESHDYVLASGIFAFVDVHYIENLLPSLFACAKKGLSFNCLSILAPNKDEGLLFQNPAEILHLCKSISPNVILRHDYLPNDFTVYMRK